MSKLGRPMLFPVKKLLRLDQETSDALDVAGRDLVPGGSASDGIRAILRDWLETRGYLRSAAEHDGKDD